MKRKAQFGYSNTEAAKVAATCPKQTPTFLQCLAHHRSFTARRTTDDDEAQTERNDNRTDELYYLVGAHEMKAYLQMANEGDGRGMKMPQLQAALFLRHPLIIRAPPEYHPRAAVVFSDDPQRERLPQLPRPSVAGSASPIAIPIAIARGRSCSGHCQHCALHREFARSNFIFGTLKRWRQRVDRCGREGGRAQGGVGGAAASMAAIANLPSLTSGGLLHGSSSSGGGEKEGEANSCFLPLRARGSSGAAISCARSTNLTAPSSSLSSSSSVSFSASSSSRSGSRRSRGLTNGDRISFLQGDHTVLLMIHRLACACNGDRQRQQTVCNGLSKGSENAAHQMNGDPQRTEEQPYGIPDKMVPERWDVVGLGQAMVDFSGTVGDEFVEELGLVKGTRKVVNHEERGKVLRALDGRNYKLSAGGSLSNTLVALARLGIASGQSSAQNVAMTGSVGSDALGDFYRTKLLRANVHFLSQPVVDGTTGTVIVLTTPDAQRTMLSYQGMSSIVNFDTVLAGAIAKSRVLVVEGYLWEISQTIEAIAQACEAARQQGVLVALTASDVSCVTRHRQQFWDVMCQSTDILFANADEARALCAFGDDSTPEQAAKHLNQFCPLVSVTDGARGSYIGLRGELVFIPPAPCVPVDTCGAGDAYAAGVLYGLLRGVPDVKGMGDLAARVAAVVVGQQGTRLKEEAAVELAESVNSLSDLLDTRIMELMGMKDERQSKKISSV